MTPYEKLLSGDTPSDHFVLNGLRLLEADFREQALRALSDWERSGLSVRDDAEAYANLFAALAALQRPSWGHWNGLLTALRKARATVRKSKAPDRLEPVASAVQLERVVTWVETPLVPDLVAGLQPLRELVHSGLRGKLTLGQALGMAIMLRNRVAHDAPDDPAWWRHAADALRPLLAYGARTCGEFAGPDKGYPAPWFVTREGKACAFHGLEKSRIPLYISRQGVSQPEPGAAQDVLHAFRRLLGQVEVQERDFHKLLIRLAPEELQGVMLGDYLVGRPMASGGFATVHIGRQLSTGRKVAIKVLQDGLSDEQRWRFQQEAAYLARFDHPHIVRVFGQGEDTWTRPKHGLLDNQGWFRAWSRSAPVKSYIALEWINGPTLDAVFRGPKLDEVVPPREVSTVACWFLQAARALEAVHAEKLLHRDLTPSNLMLTPDGRVKLMDFGIARTLGEARTLKTAKGDVLGKPAYMAPEQLRAEGAEAAVGPGADLYALCATFYELFTSVRLYHHDTTDPATVLALKIQGEAPEAPRRNRADLPWEIATILEGGLQTEPGDRYPSAAALAEDLRRFLADEPILYRRPSLRRRATLFARRNRAIVRLSAVFLGLAFLGAVGFAVALSVERANTKAQTKIASEQKRIASEKTEFAGEKEKLARQKQKEARVSEFLKRREVYSADMKTALRAWDANKPGDVRALLDKHDPRFSKVAEDLRGFEWYYLHRLLSGSLLSLEVDGKARAVCFAPDGKRLAAIVDKPAGLRTATGFRIKLWKLPGGELERTILIGRGTGLVERESLTLLKQNLLGEQSVAFSPDGKLVAGTCMIVRPQQRDGVVKVWEADTGREVFSRNDDAIGGRAVEFSPDGRYLLVGGYKNAVLVWELDGGNLRWSLSALDPTDFRNNGEREIPRPGVSAFDAVPVVSLRFSRDGKYLLRSSDKLTRSAWPPKEGGPPFRTRSVDEDAIASSYLKTERVITLALKSRDWDLAVAPDVSPNAIHLLTTRLIIHPQLNEMRNPGQPRFESGQVATLSLDSGPIQRLAFGEPFYLAMNSGDGLVTVGLIDNSRNWNGRFRLRGHEGEISSLAFSPNGRNLAAAGRERVTVWETRGRPELRPLLEALSARASAPRSNPGRTGINTQQGVMLADNRWVVSLVTAVTPNEKTLSYDRSHRIMVMDPTHPEAPPTWFDPPIPGVVTVAVSPDRSLCAVWGTGDIFKQSRRRGPAPVQPDRAIVSPMYILEAAAGQPTPPRHILPRNGLSMMFAPDGRRLVSAAPVEGVVRLWDVVTGKEIRSYPVRANRVGFNADGRWIVTGNPAEINLLNPEGGDVVQKFLIDLRQPVWAFRPDGLRLAFAAQGGRIRVWDLEKNQQERDFSAQGQVIEALAYDPEGARLLTYSESRDSGHDITIWSLESGEDIFTIPSAELPVDQFLHFAAVMAQVERRWKAEAEAR